MSEIIPCERSAGIGGSEIAAIVGLSPWVTPFDIWLRKTGQAPEQADNAFMTAGKFLEPAVAKMYAAQQGLPALALRPGVTVKNADFPHAVATPDYYVDLEDCQRGLEIKTANLRQIGEWGPGNSIDGICDEIPQYYALQCHWYMSVTAIPVWDVSALIAGNDHRTFTLESDAELVGLLHEAAARFWRDHVVANKAPGLQASETAKAWLASRWPKATHALRDATPEEIALAKEYEAAKAAESAAKDRKDNAKTLIVAALKEAEGFTWDGGKVTYKNTKPSEDTDWPALARSLAATHNIPAAAFSAAIKSHTAQKGGGRRIYTKIS